MSDEELPNLAEAIGLDASDPLYAVAGNLSRKITSKNLGRTMTGGINILRDVIPFAQQADIKDGTTTYDAVADIDSAFTEDGPFYFPRGTYLLSSAALATIVNKDVHIFGDGINQTILKCAFPTGNGLTISQDTFNNSTFVGGLSVITTQAEPGDALQITYAGADTANRHFKRCKIDNVEARGDDKTADGWTRGIVGVDIHNWLVLDCTALGRQNNAASGKARFTPGMTDGIILTGSAGNPSNFLVSHSRVWNADNAFRATGDVEGLHLRGCGAIACDVGVKSDRTPSRPYTELIGNHFNIFTAGADLSGSAQVISKANLIYKIEHCEATDHTWAYLLDNCDLSQIEGDTWINLGTDVATNGNSNGAKITDSDDVDIKSIIHERPSISVSIEGTSVRCRTIDVKPQGAYTGATQIPYQDIGTGQNSTRRDTPQEKITKDNTVAVTTTAGGAAVAVTESFDVEVNDEWDVVVQYRHEKGAIAGDTAFTLAKGTGTAAITFMHGETALRDRFNQDNSNPDIAESSMPGSFTVTTRGTLTLQLTGTSLGSNGTVPINKAQIVARRVG